MNKSPVCEICGTRCKGKCVNDIIIFFKNNWGFIIVALILLIGSLK